ncbi:hypothetical protein GOC19_06370 [Sinorhizobium meliloti]|nr:hypothetical protein [Sinorhizobium meliloti]MDX0056086.1 hypothetical protein [Sinorhizobium meliloti]
MAKQLTQYIAIFFVLFYVAFVPMAKIALGAALAFLGAFFPGSLSEKDGGQNRAAIKLFGSAISLSGSLRFGVIFAGVLIISSSLWEAKDALNNTPPEVREEITGEFWDFLYRHGIIG